MQTDALLVAFIRQLLQYIAFERSGINNVVIGTPGVKHRKAFVVTGRKADVLCSGSLDGRYPSGGIELGRIKATRQFGIFLIIQILIELSIYQIFNKDMNIPLVIGGIIDLMALLIMILIIANFISLVIWDA